MMLTQILENSSSFPVEENPLSIASIAVIAVVSALVLFVLLAIVLMTRSSKANPMRTKVTERERF
ncbi:MAG: hypothetical protein ACI841_000558 [Planctomycetota bacterium]|jgi:hypothetical protein